MVAGSLRLPLYGRMWRRRFRHELGLPGHIGGPGGRGYLVRRNRITSYNVCYTKLLRDTTSAARAEAERTYYASHAWNPFFFQGTKTFAYEVWEQLGFCTPDALLLPAGNGTLVIGSFIGFRELLENGLIDKLPRLIRNNFV